MTLTAAMAALLEPSRMMVAGALARVRRNADDVAGHTELDRAEVLRAVTFTFVVDPADAL